MAIKDFTDLGQFMAINDFLIRINLGDQGFYRFGPIYGDQGFFD